MRSAVAALGSCLLVAGSIAADPGAEALLILSPEDGAYVSGPQVIRLALDPPELAGSVERVNVAADGRIVCSLDRAPFECAWDAGADVAGHQIRAVAVFADRRRLVRSVRTRRAAYSLGSSVCVVQVAATVTDTHGDFIKGLGKGVFRVFEDDRPQEIAHFVGQGMSREIVVAVDLSGSMTDALPQVRQAVKEFLASLLPDDHVTLLAFNDNIFTLARRESSPAARLKAVDRLAPWGGTALYDVILRALDILGQRTGRKALVVFTDGEDRSSHASVSDVEKRSETNDAPVYMIGQGRGTKDPELKRILDHLGRVSGGRAFFTDEVDELRGVFAQIAEELSSQYLLAYQPTNQEQDGSWRRIRVELLEGRHVVRARQGYRAASAPRARGATGR